MTVTTSMPFLSHVAATVHHLFENKCSLCNLYWSHSTSLLHYGTMVYNIITLEILSHHYDTIVKSVVSLKTGII